MLPKIGIAGTGSFLPKSVVTNAALADLIKVKPGVWAQDKLGIRERRFMTPLDSHGHPIHHVDELDMAERAALDAMRDSGVCPDEVGGLWYISCTQPELRRHFSQSAFDLHKRLKLPASALPLEMDAGCGGTVQALGLAKELLCGGDRDNLLVVAASGPSNYYGGWESYVTHQVWLSMFIFGDGAGAILLKKSKGDSVSEIIASYMGVDPTKPLMEYASRGNDSQQMYIIDGRAVAASFGIYAKKALEGLKLNHDFSFGDVQRFYFHQVNGKVLDRFVLDMDIPPDRVAKHVERYGNVAAAAIPVLLDEDRKAGIVDKGDLCVLCAVGAGAQYGAMLVRL